MQPLPPFSHCHEHRPIGEKARERNLAFSAPHPMAALRVRLEPVPLRRAISGPGPRRRC
jgi:hypothetical protein